MFQFLKRLFRKREPSQPAPEKGPDIDQRLDRYLETLRERLRDFLIVRNRPAGEMIKRTEQFSVQKSNSGLFRLEAEGLSILISISPFLGRKDGKITGLLNMSEIDLCRALQGKGGVSEFLQRSRPVNAESRALYRQLLAAQDDPAKIKNVLNVRDDAERELDAEDLEHWQDMDVYQVIARCSPNTLAHVLLHVPPEIEGKVRANISTGLKFMLMTEFEALSVNRSDPNPHSKTRSLLQFDEALGKFREQIQVQAKRIYLRERREGGADELNS